MSGGENLETGPLGAVDLWPAVVLHFFFCLGLSDRVALLLPLLDESKHLVADLLSLGATAERIDESTFGIHEVEEDTVVYQVVVCRARCGWSGEVDPVGFAGCFDGFVCARQTD